MSFQVTLANYKTSRAKIIYFACISALAMLLWLPFLRMCFNLYRWDQPDFVLYFKTAQLLLDYKDPYIALSASTGGIPPTAAILFMPLNSFSPKVAWTLFTLATIAGSLWLAVSLLPLQRFKDAPFHCTALLSGFLLSYPQIGGFAHAHSQILILMGLIGGWRVYHHRHRSGGAFLIGLFASLKLFPLPLIMFFLVTRRYRAFFYSVLGSLVPLLFIMSLSPNIVRSWLVHGAPILTDASNHMLWNASLPGCLRQLFPSTLTSSLVLWIGIFSTLILGRWVCYKGLWDEELLFYILLVTSVVCSPTAWPTYFVFLFPLSSKLASTQNRDWLRLYASFGFAFIMFLGFNTGYSVASTENHRTLVSIWLQYTPCLFAITLCLLGISWRGKVQNRIAPGTSPQT